MNYHLIHDLESMVVCMSPNADVINFYIQIKCVENLMSGPYLQLTLPWALSLNTPPLKAHLQLPIIIMIRLFLSNCHDNWQGLTKDKVKNKTIVYHQLVML